MYSTVNLKKQMTDKLNSANGVSSYDSTSSGSLIHFFNRNVTPYATESSGPKFDLVPVDIFELFLSIVANLYNLKILPPLPTLSCR